MPNKINQNRERPLYVTLFAASDQKDCYDRIATFDVHSRYAIPALSKLLITTGQKVVLMAHSVDLGSDYSTLDAFDDPMVKRGADLRNLWETYEVWCIAPSVAWELHSFMHSEDPEGELYWA